MREASVREVEIERIAPYHAGALIPNSRRDAPATKAGEGVIDELRAPGSVVRRERPAGWSSDG